MKNESNLPILHRPIPELGLSSEFSKVSEMHGFFTLKDLSKHNTSQLLQLPGFTQHLIYEYVNFMEVNGLGQLIDPM